MTAVEIDVWADVVCPWCYIGKRRLEQAIAESTHPADVTVTYHAYELDPGAPVGDGSLVLPWLAERYGTDLEGAREMAERPAVLGRPDGLEINVDEQRRANSFDAHRIVALGLAQGGHALQAAVLERLYSAHFAEGRQIDDIETLQRLGAEAGLDGRRLSAVLASREYADQVRQDERAATEIGITGVPFFMANRKVALSGAHSAEVIGQLIEAATDGSAEVMTQGA
ncbi:DsbA family oxidoreductase [Phycicoccus sp. 3266]|uniref:DsbA family oxidoreductase n=1 Tax=Phycicoccus sp. 3266 TaxID=2817751 RepID=UPI0028653AE3|nr:DsbA family oxidoreductase [Phycicoccus sp. 3266]MDR6862746.1 putative DsbA family dithiol-disulfide isomerase [Phycicoccus sp. 3266]